MLFLRYRLRSIGIITKFTVPSFYLLTLLQLISKLCIKRTKMLLLARVRDFSSVVPRRPYAGRSRKGNMHMILVKGGVMRVMRVTGSGMKNRRHAIAAMLALLSAWCFVFPSVLDARAMPSALSNGSCANAVNTGGGCAVGTDKLSTRDQVILEKKQTLASEYADMRAGKVSYTTYRSDLAAFLAQYGGHTASTTIVVPDCVPDPNTGQCPVSANSVNLIQQPQTTTYYCGPATASEVLGVRGVSKSQSFLAGSSYLNTDASKDTPWNPYVMHPTLNTLLNTAYYVAVDGSAVGGGFTTSTWEQDLKYDVDNGWAIAGNIVEYANTDPHLVGHPRTMTIYHWIGIYGYSNNGGYTKYADSVSGDTQFWSWAANVPAYSSFSSSDMTTLLNQRGFVW